MTPPQVIVLDTRTATDKASFLAICAEALQFPSYFGGNWDAFEECLRDVGADRVPALVVWTGASVLPGTVRDTAAEIFDAALPDGVDVLVVDDVSQTPQPDFAVFEERLPIPRGRLTEAREFWTTVGLYVAGDLVQGDAIVLSLIEVDDFHPVPGPVIAASRPLAVVQAVTAAGYSVREAGNGHIVVTDPFGNTIEFTPY